MAKVTALTAQKRNKERVNVFLDGQFAFGLALPLAAGIQVGQILTPEDVARLQAGDTVEQAKQSAYRFLSYRPRSISEVRRNLKKKEYDEGVIEQVIQRLLELNLLDDHAFADYWVEQRETFKPRSLIALRQELAQKGVNRTIIEEALADVDESAAAYRAAESRSRRWQHLPEETFLAKLQRFLQGRGFNYAITRTVARQLWEENEAASEDETQQILKSPPPRRRQ